MIELYRTDLRFSFPEVHESAHLTIDFQYTLRIPDDGNTYPLPPGLGSFPLRHVDDFAGRVPASWIEHGGVMFPMYQAEAMWIHFASTLDYEREVRYPFAVRIAAGKINAVTGEAWAKGLHEAPQDYVVAPLQPWLDGFCVEKGTIRQFVAMPLGKGYTAEEQLTGAAEHGGLQLEVFPMKRAAFERRFPPIVRWIELMCCSEDLMDDMGLGAGGRMKQEIYADPYDFEDWDLDHGHRCFVHIANSERWRAITGEAPRDHPIDASRYSEYGLPWFDYYSEKPALEGSPTLAGLDSIAQMGKKKGETPLPENESVIPQQIIQLREGLEKDQVREGRF